MIISLFTVYDEKVMSYFPPLSFRNKGEAVRTMTDILARDTNSNFAKFPEDYSLYEIGTMDDSSGIITPFNAPVFIGKLIEFVKSVN